MEQDSRSFFGGIKGLERHLSMVTIVAVVTDIMRRSVIRRFVSETQGLNSRFILTPRS